MAEQLFNHFADIQAIELEKKKILSIYGEIKQGIIELSQLGFKIDAGKSIKEITGYQKQIQDLQGKLVEGQRRIDDSIERSRILQEKAGKEEANRKLAELKLREANERAIQREIDAEEKRKSKSGGGLKDRPIESIPFEVKGADNGNLKETGDAINDINKAEVEGVLAANEWAAAQKKAGDEVRNSIGSEAVGNVTQYKDELERMTGTLSENRQIQNIYKKELGEVQQQIKLLESTTSNTTKQTDAYQQRLGKLTATEAALKKEITDLNGTIKQQTILENAAAGSLDGMNARLLLLNKEYAKLSTTAKASPLGTGLKAEITQLNTAILAEESALGRSQKNVGNYSNSIVKAAGTAFGAIRKLAYILPGLGIAGIFGLIFEGISSVVQSLDLFGSKAEKNFKILSDVSQNAADGIGKSVGEVDALYKVTQNLSVSLDDRRDATQRLLEINKENNKLTGDQTTLLVNQNGVLKENDIAIGELTKSLYKQAYTRAYLSEIEKAFSEVIKAQNASLNESTSFWTDLFNILKGGGTVTSILSGQVDAFGNNLTKANQKLGLLQTNFTKGLISGELDLGGIFGDPDKATSQLNKYQIDLKAMFELRKKYLQDEIELNKSLSEVGPEVGRISARQRQFDLEKQLAEEERAFNEDTVNQKAAKELEAAKNSIKNTGELNRAIGIINKNADNEKLLIEKNTNDKIIDLQVAFQVDLIKIKQQEFYRGQAEAQAEIDRLKALEDEKFDIKLKADERQRQIGQDKIEISRDVELERLERRFQKEFKAARGNEEKEKRAIKKYEKEKEEIQSRANLNILKNDLIFYESRLTTMKAFSTGSIAEIKAIEAAEKALAATRLAIAKAESQGQQTKSKNKREEGDPVRDALDKIVQINAVLTDAIGGALNAAATRRKNIIQEQIDDIERLKEADIERINASADSEEKKAAKIKLVEARAASEREKLERRRREIDLQQARFEKAAAIMNIILSTAVNVSRATTPFGKAIALASGAVQLGIAIATPLPKFFKGTDNAPAGPAEVAEQGRELAIEPSGKVKLFTHHSVQNLIKGTKIFPNQVTERILAATNVHNYQKLQPVLEVSDSHGEEIVLELKEIKKRTGFTVIINQGIDPTWWSKHMKN